MLAHIYKNSIKTGKPNNIEIRIMMNENEAIP